MKEIKFRMWGMNQGNGPEMIYSGDVANLYLGQDMNKKVSGTLMQYTGLKDKNGKEIYEGDIIKSNSLGNEVVEYNAEADWPGFYLISDGWRSSFPSTCEVVGNIYENPEMITNA